MRTALFVLLVASVSVASAEDPKAWIGLSLEPGSPEGCAGVREVFAGSAGEAAGLKAGDRVCALDGEPVTSAADLIGRVGGRPVGTEVKLQILRDRKRSDVTLRLSPRPEVGEAWIRQQRVGKPVGELSAAWLQGKPAPFAEKVTILEFWEPWCGPCVAGMPALKATLERHAKDVQLVSIASDGEERIRAAMKDHGMTWTVGYDAKNATGSRLFVTLLPTILFVDRDGVLRDVLTGRQDEKTLEEHLKPLLGKP